MQRIIADLFLHDLLIMGNVSGSAETYTYYTPKKLAVDIYHVTAATLSGASGGPWLDKYGRVIGNQSGYMKEIGAQMAMVIPSHAIKPLVLNYGTTPVRKYLSADVADYTDEEKRWL